MPEPSEPAPPEPVPSTAGPGQSTEPPRDDYDASDAGSVDAAPARADVPPPRQMDDTLRAVLREEAEREARARRAEAAALETQPDLGLAETPRPKRPLRQESDAVATDREDASAVVAARRNQLPDIEEINSSLKPAAEHGLAMAPVLGDDEQIRRRGFRVGFIVAMVVAVVLLTLYLRAPQLSEQFPALSPWLQGYTALIDSWRIAIADGAETAMQRLTEIIASVTG